MPETKTGSGLPQENAAALIPCNRKSGNRFTDGSWLIVRGRCDKIPVLIYTENTCFSNRSPYGFHHLKEFMEIYLKNMDEVFLIDCIDSLYRCLFSRNLFKKLRRLVDLLQVFIH